MQVYGKEVNFKISRLEDAQRLELALQKMGKREEEIKASKDDSLVSALKNMLGMLRDFFIDATKEDALEGCTDVVEAKTAYLRFLTDIDDQKKGLLTFTLDDIK